MRFARLSLLLLAAPALAAGKPLPPLPPLPPPLPPLVLPASAPLIEAVIAGTRVMLTVDPGGDDIVQINPASPLRAVLAGAARPDGVPATRGTYLVAVGQTALAIPFSRETVVIAGRPVPARVLQPAAPPQGQIAGSDGTIGLPLLPHDQVRWELRPAAVGDGHAVVPARIGRSDSWGFDWALPGKGGVLEVELHPLRPAGAASVAAASLLAAAGDGALSGPVRRVVIGFGAARPVRTLVLARPVVIAGTALARVDVRLFDWAGKAELPPDADAGEGQMVIARRGRQRGWAILKLGNDVLGRCASISWQRDPGDGRRSRFDLRCPA